jgi:hypothetical protein
MSSNKCEKCGEMVEAAKAFCPECGSPLVIEEQRSSVSEFDASAGTIQFGQTVYNKLLSDMGLNISELQIAPPQDHPAETQPKAEQAAADPKTEGRPAGGRTKWIIAGILVFLLAVTALVVVVSLFVYMRWEQL